MGRHPYVMLAFPLCHWQDSILEWDPGFNVRLLGIDLSPSPSPWGGDNSCKLSNSTVIVCNCYCYCCCYSSSSSQKQSHRAKKRWADIHMSRLPSLYVTLAFPSCHWQDLILEWHPGFNVQLLGIDLSPSPSPWGGGITCKLSDCTVIVCNCYCCCSSRSSQKQSHSAKKRWADIHMSRLPSLRVTGKTRSWKDLILEWHPGFNVWLLGIDLSHSPSPWGGGITCKLSNSTVTVCNCYCCCWSSSSQKQSHCAKKRWADIHMSHLPSLRVIGRTWSCNGILDLTFGYWASFRRPPQALEEVALPASFRQMLLLGSAAKRLLPALGTPWSPPRTPCRRTASIYHHPQLLHTWSF